MNAEVRAQVLVSRRPELLSRLARKIPAARSLSEVDRELIIDEAISYTVLEHTAPLEQTIDLERVFWTAADFRVRKAVAGRSQTVRGRFKRASESALDDIADGSDPATAVEETEELRLVREFAATLAERERRVLRVKYFSGTSEPLGYKKIAQQLGISFAAARAADRSIKRSLERFAAVYAAGELCPTRELEVSALAAGTADQHQSRLAEAHVAHCHHCHASYAVQLRAMRSAAFERKVAALFPAVEFEDRNRLRGAWDAIADWFSRPFSHDTAATAAQLAASGTGRGVGTIALLKVAGACMASATALSVCATTLVVPALTDDLGAKPSTEKARKPKPDAVVAREAPSAATAENHLANLTRVSGTKPPTARTKSKQSSKTQGGTGPRLQEQTPSSPAPSNAAPGGESEFNPTYTPSAPPAAAPAAAAPGGNEFF